jgi:hypothetical protein
MPSPFDRMIARLEGNIAKLAGMRSRLDPERIAEMRDMFERQIDELRGKRRRDDGGMPALVEPPRGPLPLQGGAEAPLEYD